MHVLAYWAAFLAFFPALPALAPLALALVALISVAVPVATMLASTLLSAFVVHPLAELRGYVSDATAAEIQQCIQVIPRGVSVAASRVIGRTLPVGPGGSAHLP